MGPRAIIMLLLAAVSTAIPVRALQLDSRHPRMFFYVDSLPAVRARALSGPNQSIYLDLKGWVDTLPVRVDYMQFFAVIYLISQDTSYADKAISAAMTAVDQDLSGYTRHEGIGWGQISPLVLVYDWCYDRLSTTQRQQIQDRFAWSFSHIPDGHPHGYDEFWWGYQYATAGEGVQGDAAMAALQRSVDYLSGRVLPCYNSLKPGGSEDGYFGKYASKLVQITDCLKHSGSVDLMGGAHVQHIGRFWAAAFRPDQRIRRMLDKYNSASVKPNLFWAWAGTNQGDQHAQALVKRMVADHNYDHEDAIWLLAWYNPSLPSIPLADAPRYFWDSGYNWYIGRTGWTLGNQSSDVVTMFSGCAAYLGGHSAVGHWEVSRGVDDLIGKSARYGSDLDIHFNPWLLATHAFNGVLIYDATEDMGTFAHRLGMALPMPNTGQQNAKDNAMARSVWPNCLWADEWGYTGEVTKYEQTDSKTLIECDASKAYAPAKALLVLRRWQWYQPDWVIVQDRVVLGKSGLPVKSLIHSIARPDLGVTPATILGNWTTGGVFTASVSPTTPIRIDHGASSARVYVVLATGAGNPTTELRVIGGGNSQGQAWKQNLVAEDYGYVSNPSEMSYEFYVEQTQQNYMPSDPNRIDDEAVANRWRPPEFAGDWRIEITVDGARDTVDIAYVVHVTDRGAPVAQVASSWNGNTLWVTAGEGALPLLLSPPGREASHLERP